MTNRYLFSSIIFLLWFNATSQAAPKNHQNADVQSIVDGAGHANQTVGHSLLPVAVDCSPTQPQLISKDGHLFLVTSAGKFPARAREAEQKDFNSVVDLNWKIFPHDNDSRESAEDWVRTHWNTPERKNSRYYVITHDLPDGSESKPVGYILWTIRGGFKKALTVELDQLAVDDSYRRQKFATGLIRSSLDLFKNYQNKLHPKNHSEISILMLTTGSENEALKLYQKTLGVESKGKIGALFGKNEYGEEELMLVNENMAEFMEKNPLDLLLPENLSKSR